ncbi:MAG: hypothetical protein JXR94_17055 [Candidatus Hydrogenedentes bacterium]|nr:hypothetical protein [Candidatus Hydrogenedentota bacterium]
MKSRPFASRTSFEACLPALAHCLLAVCALALCAPIAGGLDEQSAFDTLMKLQRTPNPPGNVLFEEGFEHGNLDQWTATPGVAVVDADTGRCARFTSSENIYEEIIVRAPIAVEPSHRVAILWRARLVSPGPALHIRIDFAKADGTKACESQQYRCQAGADWTENTCVVSDFFTPDTRTIILHFHHAPKDGAVSMLDAVRVVDLSDAAAEYIAAALEQAKGTAADAARRIAAFEPSPGADAWKGVVSRNADEIGARIERFAAMDFASPEFVDGSDEPVLYARRLADAADAIEAGWAHPAPVLTYSSKPISAVRVLPYGLELEGAPAAEATIHACPGERESASIVLWAPEDTPAVSAQPTDLTGPGGVIPASRVDIKIVKCWYQAWNGWRSGHFDRDRKVLVPELLLNDDSLVKVYLDKKRNYLRLAYKDGARYAPIDDPEPQPWGTSFTAEEFPVADAPGLLPFDLAAGQNKQLWLTVHVPADTPAGTYTGEIEFTAADAPLARFALTVQVLPFTLASPTTRYDADAPFTYSLYCWGYIHPENQPWISHWYKSEAQFRTELQAMYDHNIVSPTMIWPPTLVYGDKPRFRRQLAIMKDIGMAGRPLHLGDSGLIGAPTSPAELEALKENIRKTIGIAVQYGFTSVYFYGLDEATGDRLLGQRAAWQAVHEAGGKVMVSVFPGYFDKVGDLLDLANRAGDPAGEPVEKWHANGARLYNYANRQTTVENPEIHRRNYGLYLWALDFDGACTYCLMGSQGTLWNDFDQAATTRDHNFALPTTNGIVETLAFQGYREAADDLRYLTTLRQAIAQAATGSDAARATAAKAQAWIDALDVRAVDLDAARADMIRWILELRDSGAS